MLFLAIGSLATGFLSIAFSSIPILGLVLGVFGILAGGFASVKTNKSDLRLAAATGLLMGTLGCIGSVNRAIESVAIYRARQGLEIEADEIQRRDGAGNER